ncbi:MAG: HD domain-containing protein, partial [Rickettsiales bacterium]
NKDILTRDKTDVVRIAYNLALELHDGQKRKGIDKYDHITHSLQVYDLVSRVVPRGTPKRDVVLAAALLHDGIEDYKNGDAKAVLIDTQAARAEAVDKIKAAFPDKKFSEKLLEIVGEVTNPIEFTDKKGEIISKRDWQVEHIKNVSSQAKLIKVCDQTMNVISSIEEVPDWNYKRVTNYANKATAVVNAVKESNKTKETYFPFVAQAVKIYDKVSSQCQEILDNMNKEGESIPPNRAHASISLRTIILEINNENKKMLDR